MHEKHTIQKLRAQTVLLMMNIRYLNMQKTTLTEVLPCFFLRCKAYALHDPHSSQSGDNFYVVSLLLILV